MNELKEEKLLNNYLVDVINPRLISDDLIYQRRMNRKMNCVWIRNLNSTLNMKINHSNGFEFTHN